MEIVPNQTVDERKLKARKRWQILAQVLKGSDTTELANSAVSVRRFQTFGLLSTEKYEEERSKGDSDGGTWFKYSCQYIPGFSMKIRHLGGSITAERLNGFNNTGNVCVWPSEEVMAFYCMQHLGDFKGQNICELGGGMTCLAGVALGLYSEANSIELSDGNEESVDNLNDIFKKNNFGETRISSSLIRWGSARVEEKKRSLFDTVICADCLFFDEGREDLSQLVFDLLKPGGTALMFAPSRNGTFQIFADLASKQFQVKVTKEYDNCIWNMHNGLLSTKDASYDESLHFPIMMSLVKPLSSSRDATPESR